MASAYLEPSRFANEFFYRLAVGVRFIERELHGPGKFIVEIGSNDGIVLNVIAKNGLRHLGVEPCDNLAKVTAANGVRVLNRYFDESSAAEIVAAHGRADVIFAANTFSHISRVDSVLHGTDRLASGRTDTTVLLRSGRGLLLDLSADTSRAARLGDLLRDCAGRVALVLAAPQGDGPIGGLDTVLIRPDGHVAWAGTRADDPGPALRRWFGPRRRESPC